MLNHWLNVVYLALRPLIKWFLNKFTRLCELQRLCYGIEAGSKRVKKVERSIALSRMPQIKNLRAHLDNTVEHGIDEVVFRSEITNRAVNTILLVKRINPKVHLTFPKSLGQCIDMIWGYRRLYFLVESLRTESYDEENEEHEKKLIDLWNLLMQETPLESRVTKQWQEIGFQGDDPKTDFRGMGLLGLENLVYFARKYPGTARHLLSHSHHPHHGYTFAVVGINITSMAYRLLKNGEAKTHFYNLPNKFPRIENFHQFYCYLFFEFDRYWVEAKPKSIMEFSEVHRKFEYDTLRALTNNKCLFKMNMSIENI